MYVVMEWEWTPQELEQEYKENKGEWCRKREDKEEDSGDKN